MIEAIFPYIWVLLFLLLFLVSEILARVYGVSTIYTRMFLHMSVGLLLFFHPIVLRKFPFMEILTIGVLPLLYLAQKNGSMKSLFSKGLVSRGTYFYPISIYLIFLMWRFKNITYLYYFMPIMTMVFPDMIAAIIGRNIPWKPYRLFGQEKTVSGNIAFFVSTFILSYVYLVYYYRLAETSAILTSCFLYSVILTIVEGVSMKGWDNLTIPISAYFVLLLLENLVM